MEYVHAVLLLHSAKQPVNEENLKKVIAAAGLQVDEARVKAMVAALEGVNIDEAIKSAAVPAVAAPSAPAAPAKPEEKKKEEKVEEKKEEEALAGLGALFG
ncbi:MAG: 50S ribosomal protein P1 [Candidatus Hadarchaeum yellowstonense]|jgi:large subunit ribosomal protein L12|uniref:Large ribosomal subunit protein P1 n=1 Tax=Hadarchaeum yellowstonense TaxID=1776334 RepID=A0A147JUD6_HADYE|nr:MAG: 50S ribosomal protein P1 [Candidatus Hadarchaeum yellowstonense]